MPTPGRHGAEFWKARDMVLAGATVCQMPNCKFPGQPLHHGAPRNDPLKATVDHVIPVSLTEGWSEDEKRRALNDPRYMRPAHMACNAARGNRRDRPRVKVNSRDWGV